MKKSRPCPKHETLLARLPLKLATENANKFIKFIKYILTFTVPTLL